MGLLVISPSLRIFATKFLLNLAKRPIPSARYHRERLLHQSSMIAGAERVDLRGNPVSFVTPGEKSMLSCIWKNSDSNRAELILKSFKLY